MERFIGPDMLPPDDMMGGNGGSMMPPLESDMSLGWMAPPLAVSPWTRDAIIKAVDRHETDTQALRDRMEADYSKWRLDPHQNIDPVTDEVLEDYAVYTSNAPKTFGNKIVAMLSQAEVLVRVEHINDKTHPPEADNDKERLAIGLLHAADERMVRLLQPTIQAALAWNICIRGGYVGGRALLVKRPDGRTYADITPWDPLHTHWGLGQDGLAWACYKIRKTPTQILTEYGIAVQESKRQETPSENTEQEGIDVYDFYTDTFNQVETANETLKSPTPHGAGEVPAFLVLVGSTPLTQAKGVTDTIKDVGESVFEAVRDVYEKHNDIMSIMLELVRRARRQGIKLFSDDGKKSLPEDPYVEGTVVQLSKRQGEDVAPLGLLEMTKETGAFMGLVAGETQRGSLPYSAYGELQFQLSGYAITQLGQGIESVLYSRVDAMKHIYLQIANLLYRQYTSGLFDPMQLSGQDRSRKYFSAVISPQALEQTCDYTVKVVAQLPSDDVAKWSMAQMARQGPVPAASDSWIRENILGMQDAQEMDNQIKMQMAERGLAEATLFTLMKAAEDQGQPEVARFYFQKLIMLMAQIIGALPPGVGEPANPAEAGGPPQKGLRPEVQANAATGASPSPQQSNAGPSMVAPGTPRPGAQGQLT